MPDRAKDAREGITQVNVRVPMDRAQELREVAKRMLYEHRRDMLARGGAKP